MKLPLFLSLLAVCSCAPKVGLDGGSPELARAAFAPATLVRHAPGIREPGECLLPPAALVSVTETRTTRDSLVWSHVEQIRCADCPIPYEGEDGRCEGWARDDELARTSSFIRLSWPRPEAVIGVNIGESTDLPETSFTIHSGGTYTYYCRPCSGCDAEDTCPGMTEVDDEGNFFVNGQAYQFGNLIWAKESGNEVTSGRFVYFNGDGQICPIFQNDHGEPLTGNNLVCVQPE